MNRNTGILIIAVIAIVIIGAIAAFMMPAQEPAVASTLIAIDNHGADHWAKTVAVMENVSTKDGSTKNIYVETWKEPEKGCCMINLSEELGYGNEPLPAGTTFRMKMWSEPYCPDPSGDCEMQLILRGGDEAHISDISIPFEVNATHVLYQLPADITQGKTEITLDPTKGAALLEGMNTVYVEVIATVNADGTVTFTPVTLPVLCELIAGIS